MFCYKDELISLVAFINVHVQAEGSFKRKKSPFICEVHIYQN